MDYMIFAKRKDALKHIATMLGWGPPIKAERCDYIDDDGHQASGWRIAIGTEATGVRYLGKNNFVQ